MKKRLSMILSTLVAAVLLASPLAAWAQPKVAISIKAQKEVTVTVKGKQVKKKIAAKGFLPGEEIIYTLSYNNSGTEAATNVLITDPIPEGTSYIPGSASEVGDLTFSIDKGKTFKKPTLLTYEVKGAKKVASPDEYTDIRWTLPTVPPGGKGSVSFKVKVK
jgi:uncharacterized repeat protein (TIGR01451 family)